MGLITEEVEITINETQAKYYSKKGYLIPQELFDSKIDFYTLNIKTTDLPVRSCNEINVKCDICNKEYKVQYRFYKIYSRKHNGQIYCHQCASRLSMGGEKHYLWNPQKTSEQRTLERSLPENIIFIQKVMLRDNYKCIICNSKANVVHHLNAYHSFSELRYDETNGVALCNNHHQAFHCWQQQKYGFAARGNCTKEQFEEWSGMLINLNKINQKLPTTKQAVCLETKEVIDSVTNFAKVNNLTTTGIYACCNHRFKEYKGFHYLWKTEYELMSDDDVKEYIATNCSPTYAEMFGENVHCSRKVVCVTYNTFFICIKNAAKYYNVTSPSSISSCCRHNSKATYSSGETLTWMYYEEYLEKYGDTKLIYVDKLQSKNKEGENL